MKIDKNPSSNLWNFNYLNISKILKPFLLETFRENFREIVLAVVVSKLPNLIIN